MDAGDRFMSMTALMFAVGIGCTKSAQMLLAFKADVNAVDRKQKTALFFARSSKMIKLLVKHGANINHASLEQGETTLHYAAGAGDICVVNALLKLGANPNCKDYLNRTPLHTAAQSMHMGVIDVLMRFHTKVDATDVLGNNPLHMMAYGRAQHPGCALAGHGLMIDANILAPDVFGRTPLHIASYTDDEMFVKQLINGKAPVDAVDFERFTPLHIACKRGNDEVIRTLVYYGANTLLRDKKGWTALELCCPFSTSERALLEACQRRRECMRQKLEHILAVFLLLLRDIETSNSPEGCLLATLNPDIFKLFIDLIQREIGCIDLLRDKTESMLRSERCPWRTHSDWMFLLDVYSVFTLYDVPD